MSITVRHRKVGIAPRKLRMVCDMIRNEYVSEALQILRFCQKRESAVVLTKLINSSLAIASESEKYDLDELKISSLCVDEGSTLKRIQPRAKGRAFRIRKRTSHVTLKVAEK